MMKTLSGSGVPAQAQVNQIVHVLLVDDLPVWRDSLAEWVSTVLGEQGLQCSVRTSSSYAEARGMLQSATPYDLLVTDICLNERPLVMDTLGIDLVEAAHIRGIPSIALSSSVDESEVAEYYRRFGEETFTYLDKVGFGIGLRSVLNQFCSKTTGRKMSSML